MIPKFYALFTREVKKIDEKSGKPISCTATIHRKDRKFPTIVTEHVSECARNTDPWNKQTRRMIRHRAIIQCARVAFGFSAMDPDEADALKDAKEVNEAKPNFAPAVVTSEPAQTTPEAPRRGRPPKAALSAVTPIETTVTPVAPEPTAPAASGPDKVEAPKTVNFIRGIRGLLTLDQITEDELLQYGRAELGIDDSLGGLEEIQECQPSKLAEIYDKWKGISTVIKNARQPK